MSLLPVEEMRRKRRIARGAAIFLCLLMLALLPVMFADDCPPWICIVGASAALLALGLLGLVHRLDREIEDWQTAIHPNRKRE